MVGRKGEKGRFCETEVEKGLHGKRGASTRVPGRRFLRRGPRRVLDICGVVKVKTVLEMGVVRQTDVRLDRGRMGEDAKVEPAKVDACSAPALARASLLRSSAVNDTSEASPSLSGSAVDIVS